MSVWLEERYIRLLGGQLEGFKASGSAFAFRCPICGDSKKSKSKLRGYLFRNGSHYFFKCHNCTESQSFRRFLQTQNPVLFREYQLEILRENVSPAAFATPSVAPSVAPAGDTAMFGFKKSAPPSSAATLASLPVDHPAVLYCRGRKLPEESLTELLYTEAWAAWVGEQKWGYTLTEDHTPRIILPWYNRHGYLIGAQARRIDASTGHTNRYQTVKKPESEDKIYGWDRVDLHKPIYVVEGPFDSWFLPNAVASMDSDLVRMRDRYFPQYNVTYVWDNEPRNAQVSSSLSKAIKAGLSVVVWPSTVVEKDLNDMVLAGHDVVTLVKANTHRGLRAELEYLRWKKR